MVVSQTTSITPSTHAERHKPNGVDPFTSEILQSFVDGQSFTNLLENGDFRSWSAGAAAAPDGWYLSTGAIARSTDEKMGDYSAAVSYSGAAVGRLVYSLAELDRYASRSLTIGAWVKCSDANSAKIVLQDSGAGADSSYHPGDGTWKFLTITKVITGAPTYIRFNAFANAVGSTAYFDGAILVEGSVCPTFSPKPLPAITALNEYDTGKHTGIILDDTASGNHDTSAGSYTLLVEKTLSIDADMNISLGVTFTLSEVDNNGTSFGKIYRNGVAVGTERQVTGAAADLTTSEVIAGWSDGDLLQIYGYQNNGHPCRVFDLKVYGGGVIIPYPTWA